MIIRVIEKMPSKSLAVHSGVLGKYPGLFVGAK